MFLLPIIYINFMGLIDCYRRNSNSSSNHCRPDAKSLKANFWKLIVYAKLSAQLKEKNDA